MPRPEFHLYTEFPLAAPCLYKLAIVFFLLQCEASILYSGDWRMESLSFMWLMPLLKYQQDQISTRLQNVTTDNPSGTQKLLYYNNLVYLVTISLVGRSLFCPFLAKEVEPGARRHQHLFRPWWHCILQSLLCLCARPISSEAFLLRSFSSLSLALGPGYHGLLCAPSLSLSRCVVKWKAELSYPLQLKTQFFFAVFCLGACRSSNNIMFG